MASLIPSLKNQLLQLNLFNTGTVNEQTVQNERRSTRLYLFLLILLLIILTFYYTVTPFNETITIVSPSFADYSALPQQLLLQCPCSKVSIKYEKFVQIKPFYHELCHSDFMSNNWINHLSALYDESWNNSVSSDFRRIAMFQFQTLRSLCELAQDTIENGLRSFQQTNFIQSQLASKELFQAQINSFVVEFISSTSRRFLRTLYFIQNTAAQSLLMAGASLTSVIPSNQMGFVFDGVTLPFPGSVYTFLDDATCTCSSSTATSCMGTATFQNQTVPGFQTGCYMMNALLKSSLETLYNQSFIDMLTNSSQYVQKLSSSVSNKTVEILLGQMFVDYWLNTTSYEDYFNACKPDLCQYTVSQRYSFIHIATLMIGLFGGLSAALRVMTPVTITTIWPTIYRFVDGKRMDGTQSVVVQTTTVSSAANRKQTLFQFIKRSIGQLNLYKSIPPSEDENIVRNQRHSTQVYLIILLTTMSILTLFTSIKIQTVSVNVETPTLAEFTRLYNQYPLTLNCPCSRAAIRYDRIILSIKPEYHQICSSDFVSPDWIDAKFVKYPYTYIYSHDIRSQSQIHFQLLSTLCYVASRTIDDNLESFYQTRFVSPQVLSLKSFQIQTDIIVEQFKRTVPESFQYTLELIGANLELNQFIVPSNSYFFPPSGPDGGILSLEANFQSERPECLLQWNIDCRCHVLSSKICYRLTRIVSNDINYVIPGMFFTWFPLQSLLMSTLECFYNDTCLSQITAFINATVSPTNFTILKLSSDYYNNNSYEQIAALVNRLFIQSWSSLSSYEVYFNECRPLTCQYTYQSRLALVYIITTIIGLIGGLLIASRLLAPLIVTLLHKAWNYTTHHRRDGVVPSVQATAIRIGFQDRLRLGLRFVARYMIEMNLFPTIPPSQDPVIIRRNRYITRVYLILLIISLFIILMYTSLRSDTISVTVNSPSVSKYTQLYSQYPTTLKCPCRQLAIKYDKFILQFDPEYHQICSSAFVSSEWIESLQAEGSFAGQFGYGDDFRAVIRLQFLILSKFCSLSQKILNSSLSVFRQTNFVTATVISQSEFVAQTAALIEQFKKTTADQFMQILKLIQVTNHGNQLATTFSSNWKFILKYPSGSSYMLNDLTDLPALTVAVAYSADNCSCAIEPNCSKPTDFAFRTSNQSSRQILPGFHVGCLPLNALLQSSLSCLYNQSCLDMMRAFIYYSKLVPVQILTSSSFMEPDKTLETILSQIFVSQWFQYSSFDQYYDQCAAQSCQYSYSTKFNRIYIITTLIALFGGLTKGLHFIVFYAALILLKISAYRSTKKRLNNAVAPHSQQSNFAVVFTNDKTLEMVPVPTTIITQFPTDTIDRRIEFRMNPKDRIYLVCLSLLFVVAIVTASVIWFTGSGKKDDQIILSSSLATLVTSNTIAGSTTTSRSMCYMTLKYQNQTYFPASTVKSLVVNDFNRDSIPDLALTNYDNDTFSIMLGNGNGTFQRQLLYYTGYGTYPWGIATGYFNNDTLLDLAVTLSGTSQVVLYYGIATDILFIQSSYILNGSSVYTNAMSAIEVADLNTDGLPDLVVKDDLSYQSSTTGSILIFFHLGYERQFESGLNIFMAVYNSMVIGDFNNDGKQNDVGIGTTGSNINTFVSLDYSHENYANWATLYYTLGAPVSLIKGKFNNDELEDLAAISSETDTLQVLLAYKNGGFIQQIYATTKYPTSMVRINFNNDSIDDLAVLSCNRTVSVFLGTSIGIFDRNYLLFATIEGNNFQCADTLKIADFNQDGKDDLAFLDKDTRSVNILLGASCDS